MPRKKTPQNAKPKKKTGQSSYNKHMKQFLKKGGKKNLSSDPKINMKIGALMWQEKKKS